MKVEGRDVPNPIAEFSQTTFPPIIMQQIAQARPARISGPRVTI